MNKPLHNLLKCRLGLGHNKLINIRLDPSALMDRAAPHTDALALFIYG